MVAAACNILAGVIVLPALSSHKLRDALATALLKLAASVSGYAGALLDLSLPRPHSTQILLLASSLSACFDMFTSLTTFIHANKIFEDCTFSPVLGFLGPDLMLICRVAVCRTCWLHLGSQLRLSFKISQLQMSD